MFIDSRIRCSCSSKTIGLTNKLHRLSLSFDLDPGRKYTFRLNFGRKIDASFGFNKCYRLPFWCHHFNKLWWQHSPIQPTIIPIFYSRSIDLHLLFQQSSVWYNSFIGECLISIAAIHWIINEQIFERGVLPVWNDTP